MGWMSSLGIALQGLGAGGAGGLHQYNDEEKRRLALENAQMRDQLERLKEGGRNTRNTENNDTRAGIADSRNKSQQQIATERVTGANMRSSLHNAFLYDKLGVDDRNFDDRSGLMQRGQDIGSTDRRRGQDLTYSLGRQRDSTARRGQDISSSDRQRGQNMTFTLGGERIDASRDIAAGHDTTSRANAGDSAEARRFVATEATKRAIQKPNIYGQLYQQTPITPGASVDPAGGYVPIDPASGLDPNDPYDGVNGPTVIQPDGRTTGHGAFKPRGSAGTMGAQIKPTIPVTAPQAAPAAPAAPAGIPVPGDVGEPYDRPGTPQAGAPLPSGRPMPRLGGGAGTAFFTPPAGGQTPVSSGPAQPQPPATPPAREAPAQPQSPARAVDHEVQRRQKFISLKQQIEQRKARNQDYSDLVRQMQGLLSTGGQ